MNFYLGKINILHHLIFRLLLKWKHTLEILRRVNSIDNSINFTILTCKLHTSSGAKMIMLFSLYLSNTVIGSGVNFRSNMETEYSGGAACSHCPLLTMYEKRASSTELAQENKKVLVTSMK